MRGGGRVKAALAAPFGGVLLEAEDGLLIDISLRPGPVELAAPATPLLQEAARQLEAYFQDPRSAFSLSLPEVGTAYQQKVWRAMCAIPPGAAKSYGQLAQELGSSPRAVAGACRANHFPLLIPCHRVVGASGLGGYCGEVAGPYLAIKRWLLKHEGHA